jgi:hypothetical protein
VAALAGWAHPRIDSSYGSQNYTGEVPDAVAKLSPWVLLATVAAVYVLIWRRRAVLRGSLGAIPIAALALLLVAICASKVLSPQFLIWTFPVVALCAAQTRWLPRAAALAVGVATALTQLGFPVRYWDLVALESAPLAILVARNLTLLTAAALAIAALVTLPDVEGATSTS